MDKIAERQLYGICRETAERHDVCIEIYKPYLLEAGKDYGFDFANGTAGCEVKIFGLPAGEFNEVIYGADSVQALALCSDIDPILRRVDKKYELFFPSGEKYFE